jgi:hypothetical protein
MNIIKGFNQEELIKKYNDVGLETRNMKFLAKWYCKMFNFAHLPSIDLKQRDQLTLDKLKLSIFNIMADDLVDNSNLRNKELFDKISKIPWNTEEDYEDEYLQTAKEIWLDFEKSMKSLPRYEEFKEIFYFDLEQYFDSMKYSMLVNTMGIDNTLESRMYLPHNMQVVLFLDLDLMCSPEFNKEELGKLRPILLWTQDLLHLAHVISTYPREVRELDFSSPMISIGLSEGIIKREDVIKNPETTIENLKYFEPYLARQAEEELEKINDQAYKIESIDIGDFYLRVKKVYNAFLQREHYWTSEEIQKMKKIEETKFQTIPDYSVKWVRT